MLATLWCFTETVWHLRRYAECETLIMEHKKGILKLSPGMGADETLEAKLQVCEGV